MTSDQWERLIIFLFVGTAAVAHIFKLRWLDDILTLVMVAAMVAVMLSALIFGVRLMLGYWP